MRGVLIDPYTQTTREVTLDDNNVYGVAKHLIFEGRKIGIVQTVPLTQGLEMWLDEEGLLMNWDHQAFFRFRSSPDRHFAGRCIILGVDYDAGESTACPPFISSLVLHHLIEWLKPQDVKVPAPRVGFVDNNTGMFAWNGEQEFWTYDNQPMGRPNEGL